MFGSVNSNNKKKNITIQNLLPANMGNVVIQIIQTMKMVWGPFTNCDIGY